MELTQAENRVQVGRRPPAGLPTTVTAVPAGNWFRDPRLYQIGALASLFTYGLFRLDFDVTPLRAFTLIATALLTQYACTKLWKLPRFDPKSALISALSLCLLMRTNIAALAVAAAVITVASKFVFRWNGKHLFNPTNFGIVAMLIVSDRVWVSPGQWGTATFFAFLLICIGGLVVNRAARSDVTFAFLLFWIAVLFGRSWWLGEPMTIPFHRLQSGSLLIFSFFMISDPKTTPDSRLGRVIFAFLVALGAGYIQFKLFRTNGLLWSLAGFSLLVPLIDFLLPGERYQWSRPAIGRLPMKAPATVAVVLFSLAAAPLHAFCGFYVAKADTKLYNQASQVAMVRSGDRTVMTMANDFQGDPKEFAIVVPVPTVLQRKQINVGDKALLDHLDAYSAPRLVEYHDPNPCDRVILERMAVPQAAAAGAASDASRAKSLGVTIEARYTVGEYDILILSAKQSGGLETWLGENGYKVPAGASAVLGSYIKQNMKFFVAKVNLKEQSKLGFNYLRPIQVAYNSPKFMLPIRLGTVNAKGPQELFVYVLTPSGRVETTNYRTVKLPSDAEVPLFVKNEFGPFYKAMFAEQVRRNNMSVVFLEYAWDMAWCDPCAADPLSYEELRKLGVFWLTEQSRGSQAQNVFLTRLHVRYDGAHFPEDLVFQETGDRSNFQGRYILRNPWTGKDQCPEAKEYRASLRQRQEKEAQTLATLTGWNLQQIRKKMNIQTAANPQQKKKDEESWWEKLWN
jgi:Na+-translocating ferredoxin:NAD+ oxidoreductase RnfD subunit